MGITNFTGDRRLNRSCSHTLNHLPLRVSEYMATDIVIFRQDQSIEEVIDTLIHNGISGGPVVDDSGKLVGIITEGDCIKRVTKLPYYKLPLMSESIKSHMTSNVQTIEGNMDIFDVANKFLNSKRRRFPIVERGKLIGVITQKDILKAVRRLKAYNYK
ncbi:MAG: inosine-5-monophosphate dehydrogenase [Thalassobium sp.]|nr:MAG: inosine-5-monophosphate dehydrogenase [Thalassobium sp.]